MALPQTVRVKLSSEEAGAISLTPVVVQELPVRDLVAMGLWVAGFAGKTIVWRGERFVLKGGKLVSRSAG